MATIELRNIKKAFLKVDVLKGINLSIGDGEFVSLVGPSGCGKSTLLRIIAGLEDQTSGDVLIDGRSVVGIRPSLRDLAMVFQSYALYPHLTVEENIMTPLRLRDLSAVERLPLVGSLLPSHRRKLRAIKSAVDETADVLKITQLLKRKPGQLSGGQRQRVALGRAMVRKPAAFLMDEPLSNLDAALRVHMRTELAELHRALGSTFIYVTHDQAEALTMSDRIAVMIGGEILQVAAPDQVYHDPQDLRVAEFIGSPKINTLPATLDSAGRVSAPGLSVRQRFHATSQNVTIAVRSEHLRICNAGEGGLPARIVHKENLGSDVFVHASADMGAAGARRIVVRATPETAHLLHVGTPIYIGLTSKGVMAFAADNSRLPSRLNDKPIEIEFAAAVGA